MSSELHIRRILSEVEAGNNTSQRSISSNLGIALGLTNLLLRRLVRKGWVRVIHVKPNRVRYLITPAGLAEKARMTRAYLENAITFYADARDRIRTSLGTLSSEWQDHRANGSNPSEKRIVFLGAGDVAEIGYVCLQETDLRLVGVVDDERNRPFFGLTVHPSSLLTPHGLAGECFDRLVVMSFGDVERVSSTLRVREIPPDFVFWV
jgi:hypothetical protein